MEVFVGGDIEEAIRTFKNLVQKSAILKELKIKSHFESKGQKIKRKRALNMRRLRKKERLG